MFLPPSRARRCSLLKEVTHLSFVAAFCVFVLVACTSESSIESSTKASDGKSGGRIQTISDYGTFHNSAVADFLAAKSPSDIQGYTSVYADSTWRLVYNHALPYSVANGLDTAGQSKDVDSLKSSFVRWWPDTVMTAPANYSTVMGYFKNRSAIERVLFWMDDTDPHNFTKLQYKTKLDSICDSLLTALNGQSFVETEIAFVQITKSSMSYWYNFNNSTWGGTIGTTCTVANVVQADCAGYLIGWALCATAQYLEDGHMTFSPIGGVMCPQEKARIRAGLLGALSASMAAVGKVPQGLTGWKSGIWK